MYSFKNDYSEGAHPNILKALMETNLEQQEGYGEDKYSKLAKEAIKAKIKSKGEIHFVSGGTQANLIVISSALKPYQSVISAETGHINIHETGAVEATGHKINTIKSENGKLTVDKIKEIVEFHVDEHMVKPKMVYISNTTEVGTVYKKRELEEIYAYCQNNGLYLFLDGARLGSALLSKENDLTLEDLGKLTDVFYIGGTKNGALIGEAIVINNQELMEDFRFYIKQRGALLAKGRLLGIQFLELFKDDLYFRLAEHANLMAEKLKEGIEKRGFRFLTPPVSNQIFPILPNNLIERLERKFAFYTWCKIDDDFSAIRLVTSWATTEEGVKAFLEEIS
ncbi:L-threonine aldolase [Anaerobranca californiensis DSM 14826]|uniref:L-threonine aldolase n=1 Tax=Anaerobranca californiensis DSM 14826 TaxID=1120989 RepID=A0A1M6LIH0_9FIRM|nr:low specificity L-threonine aldolase [Anaerobranca californiensis]SHJ70987.1 L-threonine aldolase [Anaerobranca californiensis DSM 14826]